MTKGSGVCVAEEFVESENRTRLFLRSWRPLEVRAVMVAVHEPGSDGVRYRCLAAALATHGTATYAIDLSGCGRSPGPCFGLESIDRRLADVRTLVSSARRCDPEAPLFMFGHGLGAVIACHYAARHPGALDGIVCEAIVLDPPWKEAILRSFHRLRELRRPPRLERRLREPLAGLSLPLLLLHGSEDPKASPCDSERLYRQVQSTDKTLQVFEGYDHRLIDGPGHALVRDKICQWIEAQLDSHSRRRRIGIEYINE